MSRPLSVALLSWEYPPAVVGGLSRHVAHLAHGLAADGHEVVVYTRGHPDAPPEEDDRGVRVVRVDEYPPRIGFDDLVPWVLAFNMSLLHRAELDLRDRPPDVLHAHDWLVAYASAALKDLHQLPLVATVHATEYGRHQGHLPAPMQVLIHQVEWWLTFEAGRVITCSEYMRAEVTRIFELPPDKVETIPNGVDLDRFAPARAGSTTRSELSPDGAPVIVFAGRLEYEKGVQTVLEALPAIDARAPGVRFVVAGAGTHREELEELASRSPYADRIRFEGFLDEDRLREVYAAADLVIVPSLYEPFGLVALETMACGSPVIAADTGGLREIVHHDITGLRFTPGDAAELAKVAVRLLTDPRLARRLSMEARSTLAERHSWQAVATRTAETYRRAIVEDMRRRERAPLRAVFERRF
ncbi:MAG: glycosyltransferase family 4 protein [Actinobacteria bacterium]|nr:glycosyltransferase family 4 protein [Actinomycetota bacterium]